MLLEFKDISYQYPGSINEVFKNLTCRISTPGFHALFGPSGVGKTTLAKMMIGEVKGFGGEILTSEIHRILYTYNLERLPGWSSVREHLQTTTPDSGKGKIEPTILKGCRDGPVSGNTFKQPPLIPVKEKLTNWSLPLGWSRA
jgi:ABC-type multidrug transport system ATPase subunit